MTHANDYESFIQPIEEYNQSLLSHVHPSDWVNPQPAKCSVDRAIADGETAGFVRILHQCGFDRILGATIVARHAGEMISEITLAIATKHRLRALSGVIHPYPTQAEAIKKAADVYQRTLLTPRTKSFLKLLTKFS